MRLRETLADVAVSIADPTVVERLTTEQAPLFATFARTPELKVIVVRVDTIELAWAQGQTSSTRRRTFGVRDLGEVEVDRDGAVGLARARAEEDELATRVGRHGDDGPGPDCVAEDVVVPGEALVERIGDAIRRALIVDEEQDRALIAVLPQMGVLVDLLPGEAAVAGEERVRVGVRDQMLADVADGHHEPDGARTRIRRPRVLALRVAVQVEGAAGAATGVRLTERVFGRRREGLPSTAVVVRDPRLQPLVARHGRIVRIDDHVHQRDPVQADHLLKVDKAAVVWSCQSRSMPPHVLRFACSSERA